jgi:hypothetical protein
MIKDEALRLALEALEMYELETNSEFQRKAITAIKAALEAKDEPVAWISPTELLVMRGNALAGAKDWRVNVGLKPEDGDVGLYTTSPQPVIDESAAKRIATALGWEAKRTWVGLTDEEISTIDWKSNETLHDFAKAIEAKLKEKNNG